MIPKEEAYNKIATLVEHFQEHIEVYKQGQYNETQTRREYIDPLFKALGWDIDNEQGLAEAYKEVIHEDKIKIGGATKAPDYCFTIYGQKKFFVEAKKPSVDIKADNIPAYQLRRYGWSARLPVSVITDFEEFSIYDCTKRPVQEEKASTSRIKYIYYTDYLQEFDFIWDTFSKEGVLKGRFDKYIQADTHKKGTATVDKEFLQTLEQLREYLAKGIAYKNKNLSEDELNFLVQMNLDRIIFLRIAEDRGVEQYGQLKSCIQSGDFYQNLHNIYNLADQKYNSGLFDFQKDCLTATISIDNKILKEIFSDLYYPHSPYEFSVMPVEILGNAYEQFLGKVIRLTPGHMVKIEEKPEVRKAGGVYYTPQYIVDYIVKNTVGKLIENKTPEEISEIKIVDPACGSGSFLIGAYKYLLEYHSNYYTSHPKYTKVKKRSPLAPDGRLITSEKKRILLNNIFGVDIDTQAVEVTKLSLLLKTLDGETNASIQNEWQLFHDRVLPNLDNNIKCGNSLIDTDFYAMSDDVKIKPFNWKKNFPDVFKQGGFDVVIGNPPYIMLQNLEKREVFNYALSKFSSAKYKIDTYQLFIEQSIYLLKNRGLLGFITPNTFLKNIHSEPLRKFIIDNVIINQFLLFNYPVFASASVDTCVSIIEKGKPSEKSELSVYTSDIPFEIKQISYLKQTSFTANNRTDFNLLISHNDSSLLNKISLKASPLNTICGAYFGIQTFDRNKFVSSEKINKNFEPVIDGWNIEPYYLKPSKEYVNYIPSSIKSGGNEIIYRQDRICIRQIGAFPIATFVPANIFTLNTIYNVYLKEKNIGNLKFLLGIINSKVSRFFWRKNNSDEKKTFPKIKKEAILSIPIPDTTNDKVSHDEIIKLVNNLLQLNKEKAESKLQSTTEQIQGKIDYCETRINQIVYQLYKLTEDEIKIVEGK